MTLTRLLILATCMLAPHAAAALMDDAAYCSELASLASRYAGSAGANGALRPDLETKQAIEDCYNGRSSAGISVLEKKLRSSGVTLPRR